MLLSIRCAPNNLSLSSVQLEPVRLHPRSHVVDTCRYLLPELSGCCWTAEAIDLRIVGVHVWSQIVTLNVVVEFAVHCVKYIPPCFLPAIDSVLVIVQILGGSVSEQCGISME